MSCRLSIGRESVILSLTVVSTCFDWIQNSQCCLRCHLQPLATGQQEEKCNSSGCTFSILIFLLELSKRYFVLSRANTILSVQLQWTLATLLRSVICKSKHSCIRFANRLLLATVSNANYIFCWLYRDRNICIGWFYRCILELQCKDFFNVIKESFSKFPDDVSL